MGLTIIPIRLERQELKIIIRALAQGYEDGAIDNPSTLWYLRTKDTKVPCNKAPRDLTRWLRTNIMINLTNQQIEEITKCLIKPEEQEIRRKINR